MQAKDYDIATLNPLYADQVSFFKKKVDEYKAKGLSIYASSSFQTHSIPMLHILSSIAPEIPVYFLNTGYHFPETMLYRDQITELFGLNLVDLKSPIAKSHQRETDGRLFFASDPTHCCFLNKTLPMEPILAQFDVWISGVRKDQNENRSKFTHEAPGTHNSLRFHPMLDWNGRMIGTYINEFSIPRHPLEAKGYLNIGCSPCTSKFIGDDETGRSARWAGLKKTECGLHTDLIKS